MIDDRPRVRRARRVTEGHVKMGQCPLIYSYVTKLFTLSVDNVTWEGRGSMLAEGCDS
jgi:hypothetical protein